MEQIEILHDDEYVSTHSFLKIESTVCDLHVYLQEAYAVIVATELVNNPGRSVTNAAGTILTQVVCECNLDLAKTVFIDHYNGQQSYGCSYIPDDPDQSTDMYSIASSIQGDNVKWLYLSPEEFQQCIANPQKAHEYLQHKKQETGKGA